VLGPASGDRVDDRVGASGDLGDGGGVGDVSVGRAAGASEIMAALCEFGRDPGHTISENGVLTRDQIISHHNLTLAHLALDGPRISVLPAGWTRQSGHSMITYLSRYLGCWMINFRLELRSGVPPYRQIVDQVKHALRLRLLEVGDQLPTVKDVVGMLAVNPNTVLKAYRELELEGLVEGRPGVGTFVVRTLGAPPTDYLRIRHGLERLLRDARAAGLDEEAIASLFTTTLRDTAAAREVA